MADDRDFLDLFVPPGARESPRKHLRHRGIAKSLLTISAVVTLLFCVYILVRRDPSLREVLLYLAAICSPILGVLFIRLTGRIELGLFLTNLAGIGVVATWCVLTGGIRSVALPWFLPNLFLLSSFGSRRMLLLTAGTLVGALVLLFELTRQGLLPTNPVPAELTPVFNLLSLGSSVLVVVMGALGLTRAREQSKRYLQDAKEAAEAANRAKSAFIASMSHELRTPLHAVMISAELLKDDAQNALTPLQVKRVDQIHQGGEVLLGLVNQVLELSRIETGKLVLKPEPLSLRAALVEALGMVESMARRQEVQIHCNLESLSRLEVMADRMALQSVLINLLTNAVKYNRHPGEVFVSAGAGGHGDVRIEIKDGGPGLPEHLREAALEPFNRLKAEGTHIEGAGLGLSITDRLVKLMSGNLDFSSVDGEGTTFWVVLPAASAGIEPPPAGASREPVEATAGRTTGEANRLDVLVAEDHPVNQELLRFLLEKWGHRVTLVPDGKLALAAVARQLESDDRFDVILMDILMPEMDGLEATRCIRRLEQGTDRHVPIVAVTACATEEDRKASFAVGMDRFLAKPFKPKDLQAILQSLPSIR